MMYQVSTGKTQACAIQVEIIFSLPNLNQFDVLYCAPYSK